MGARQLIPQIAWVPVEQLHEAEWNPRKLRGERFKNLCRSIEADPDLLAGRPILALADGAIYAGNMRFRAACKLGWPAVPTAIVTSLIWRVPERYDDYGSGNRL